MMAMAISYESVQEFLKAFGTMNTTDLEERT